MRLQSHFLITLKVTNKQQKTKSQRNEDKNKPSRLMQSTIAQLGQMQHTVKRFKLRSPNQYKTPTSISAMAFTWRRRDNLHTKVVENTTVVTCTEQNYDRSAGTSSFYGNISNLPKYRRVFPCADDANAVKQLHLIFEGPCLNKESQHAISRLQLSSTRPQRNQKRNGIHLPF